MPSPKSFSTKHYPERERQDYFDDQLKCILARIQYSSACPCKLPDDCEHCERYVCNCCEKTVGWANGAADDMGGVCDECWTRLATDDEEKKTQVHNV